MAGSSTRKAIATPATPPMRGRSLQLKQKKMTTYKKRFQKTIELACKKSNDFYSKNSKKSAPNPNYIGFGNPNSKILIIGKELAFKEDDLEQLQNESINNPYQWQQKINDEFIKETKGKKNFDPEMPYDDYIPTKGNHTWKLYEKLNQKIEKRHKVANKEIFKRNFFFTEMNTIPSKYSNGLGKQIKNKRIELFKESDFFQSFKIVILAFGSYLKEKEIKEIFQVDEGDYSLNKSRNKLITYEDKTNNKLIIHTRQLSVDTSNELLENIAKKINEKKL